MSETGYVKQWVSGPRQVTKQIGDEANVLGSFTLVLYWKPNDDGRVLWVDFELFEVTWKSGDKFGYERRDSDRGPDGVDTLDEAEWAAKGFVKWDGCTQFDVNSVHVDDRSGLLQLLNAIETAREECALAMPESDVIEEYR